MYTCLTYFYDLKIITAILSGNFCENKVAIIRQVIKNVK